MFRKRDLPSCSSQAEEELLGCKHRRTQGYLYRGPRELKTILRLKRATADSEQVEVLYEHRLGGAEMQLE